MFQVGKAWLANANVIDGTLRKSKVVFKEGSLWEESAMVSCNSFKAVVVETDIAALSRT